MQAYKEGDLLFGTLDSWLVYKLNGGGIHVTEPSNAISTGNTNKEIIMRSHDVKLNIFLYMLYIISY